MDIFKDKVAVVTGGAQGIGRCIADEFLKSDAHVCIIDKQEGQHFVGDISDKQVLERFAQEVIGKYGHVDYLINNALPLMKGIDECSYEEFQYAMSVGVTAPFYLAKLFAPYFVEGAAIVNISSSRDRMSQPQTESYTAAKGGIAALTHALAVSFAGRVRVNSISPGWIDTNYTVYEGPDATQQPAGRVGNPMDIANMALFLCSDKAGFITGENICIDGGMTHQMIYHGDNGWKLEESLSQTPDPNFWIFLCFGQSNMAGMAPIEEQDLTVSERFLSLATTDGSDGRVLGTWRKAVPPLCRADAHLSLADYFGRALLEVVPENVRIGIVSVAVEGCPITFYDKDKNAPLIAKEERDWMNGILNQYGRDPYKRLLDMAKIAAKDGVIKGILLHQGETDAYDDEWRKTVRKIYCDLQQALQFDSTAVPLLVGEVVRAEYNGVCAHANPTINDIANHYPNTYVVSSEGCPPGDDNVHFSSEGTRILGRHYANRYLEVIKH